ncbi:MAG: hypothetical protein AB3N28_03055 [Kordiimonas sp.]
MDIFAALSEGKRGAVARSTEVALHIIATPSDLQILIDALSFDDPVVVSHAAHACLTIFKTHPHLLVPFKLHLLSMLLQRDQWELIEQLSKIIPQLGCTSAEGNALWIRLLSIVETGSSSIARTCALQALADMAALDPVYEPYAARAIHYALEKGTKAMQARARKFLN